MASTHILHYNHRVNKRLLYHHDKHRAGLVPKAHHQGAATTKREKFGAHFTERVHHAWQNFRSWMRGGVNKITSFYANMADKGETAVKTVYEDIRAGFHRAGDLVERTEDKVQDVAKQGLGTFNWVWMGGALVLVVLILNAGQVGAAVEAVRQ